MIIGIVTAMPGEAREIIEKYKLKEVKKFQLITIYEGEHNSKQIVLVLSGIGKIQASIGTTYLITKYNPDLIINIGLAGNTDIEKVKVGDVFLPHTFVEHDMYIPEEGYYEKDQSIIKIKNEIKNINTKGSFSIYTSGVCVTGDQFIDDEIRAEGLRTKFGANICDMEAFAVLGVVREYDRLDDCIVIKAVSDGARSSASKDCLGNLEYAMKNSIEVLGQII